VICQGCHAEQATLHLTARTAAGAFEEGHFCEPCYRSLSAQQLSDLTGGPILPTPKRLPLALPGSLSELLAMVLAQMTNGLSPEDAKEIAESTAATIERRGGTLRWLPRPKST
jgi:hypothetical protein